MADTTTPHRIGIIGAGMRSRSVWQRHVDEHDGCELVGLADPAQAALDLSAESGRIASSSCFLDASEMIEETRPNAIIVCPIIEAHASATRLALENAIHVLVEKPLVTDVSIAEDLVLLAESRALRLGVVQNWRAKSAGKVLHDAIRAGQIGAVSHVMFRYIRDREKPHLPEYLFHEPDPILWAMSIHHFDLFRYVLGEEIVEVSGIGTRPSWSRYTSDSILDLTLRTTSGVPISYVASFSSRNSHLPQESLQIEGEHGTIYNDSQYFEPPLYFSSRDTPEPIDLTITAQDRTEQGQYELADRAILDNFLAALTDASVPLIASGRDNLGTLRAIELAQHALNRK